MNPYSILYNLLFTDIVSFSTRSFRKLSIASSSSSSRRWSRFYRALLPSPMSGSLWLQNYPFSTYLVSFCSSIWLQPSSSYFSSYLFFYVPGKYILLSFLLSLSFDRSFSSNILLTYLNSLHLIYLLSFLIFSIFSSFCFYAYNLSSAFGLTSSWNLSKFPLISLVSIWPNFILI